MRAIRRRREGQALVEFALILPLLLLLLIGIAELGWLTNQLLVLRFGGYDLTREASVGSSDAEILERAGRHMQNLVGSSSPVSSGPGADPVTGEPALYARFEGNGEWVELWISPVSETRRQGDMIRVQATWGFRPIFIGWILPGSSFTVESTGRAEYPPPD